MERRTKQVVDGGIYQHREGLRYRVENTLLDATGYERRGIVGRVVLYRQLDSGKYPTGTLWVRSERDFLRRVRQDGRLVPIFKLIQG